MTTIVNHADSIRARLKALRVSDLSVSRFWEERGERLSPNTVKNFRTGEHETTLRAMRMVEEFVVEREKTSAGEAAA